MSMLVLTGCWDPSQIGPNLLVNAVSCHLTTQSQPSSTFNQGCRLRKMFEVGSQDWDYLDMLKGCSQCWLNSRIAWGTCKTQEAQLKPHTVTSLGDGMQVAADAWNQLQRQVSSPPRMKGCWLFSLLSLRLCLWLKPRIHIGVSQSSLTSSEPPLGTSSSILHLTQIPFHPLGLVYEPDFQTFLPIYDDLHELL